MPAMRPLEISDLDQVQPSVQKLDTFQRILAFALASGARVLEADSSDRMWIATLENVFWRAQDLYVLKSPGVAITPCDVYHPTVHYLFVQKYGAKLEGRPLSTLLAECLASFSEYYLALEALEKVGFGGRHEGVFLHSLIECERRRLGISREQAEVNVLLFIRAEQANPFRAYQSAVLEMFGLFCLMFDMASTRGEGSPSDFATFTAQCAQLKYGSFFMRFNLGLNVADAVAFGGKVTTAEDQKIVSDCLLLLKNSTTLTKFLAALGLSAESGSADQAA